MNFRKLGIIFILILLLSPIGNVFAQTKNVGFIQSNIWYSKDSFEEGDKIKIYTVVFNPDARELSGTVIFFDKTVLLGSKKFTTAGKTVKDVSIDWTVNAGDHTIFAKIENARFLISGDNYEDIYLADNKTDENKISVAKKIVLDTTDATTEKNTESNKTNIDPIASINNFVKEKTPPVVSESVDKTVAGVEVLRKNLEKITTENKQKVNTQIEKLNNSNTTSTDKSEVASTKTNTKDKKVETVKKDDSSNGSSNSVLKPFKYVELFFLSLFSFVFKNKIIFYGLLLLLTFSVLRYLWRLIF